MKKFTLILSLMVAFATSAMADLTQNYYKNRNFWVNTDNYPNELNSVIENATVRGEGETAIKKDGATVQLASNPVTVTADGNVVVKFIHDGGDHMLNILGVDVVDANGVVVKSDYHYGSAGGTLYNNEYTLEGLTAGAELTLRCFVYDNTNTNDRTNSAQGYYTVTNVTGEAIQFLNEAVNLQNGAYVISEVASMDFPYFNGEVVARGVKYGNLADAAYIFTITKGNDGYYTIQVANGDYVVYTSTAGGANVAVKSKEDANDDNKWWAIRKGTNDAYRIIVPKTNDKLNAPGWNYAANLNGANRALGLWGSDNANSQWYISKAPYFVEGTAKLRIANVNAYSNGTNIVKAAEGNSPLFTFTRGENGCYTIQDVNGKFLTYESTSNHLLKLSAEADANDDNKWWTITSDLWADGKLEIFPKQDRQLASNTHSLNWAQNYNGTGANTGLGFWDANDNNSYCELEMIPTEGFYYIKGTGVGNNADWYMSYNGDKWYAETAAAGVKHIWKFEASEDGYTMLSCNLNKYANLENASSNGGQPSTLANNGAKFVLYGQGGTRFIIKDGSNNWTVRTENGGAVNYWSGETNETWQLIPVTEVEVTVNEFASICLPFAVEVEGATAYAVEGVEAAYVKLVEKADIPAGEGAILAGEGKATLSIVDEAAADWANNKLEGTTVDTYVAGNAYVLANGTEGIGLYAADLNKNATGEAGDSHFKNNANKAYLPVAEGASLTAAFYGFNWDGTTGVEKVEVENTVKAIYDLTGRKVETISAPGVYIINGVKRVVR